MRVCLFTDTLGDVNGVSRFIRNIADQSLLAHRSLHVLTSTRFQCPVQANVTNVPPMFARAMPGYPQLEIAWPSGRKLTRIADALQPDVVHVSTPGPVGSIGRRYALKRGLPLVGTYHTDFPAYVAHLFGDRVLTWVCDRAMRRFYRPFSAVFTRSDEYAGALVSLGVERGRIVRLLPGIDTDTFHTRHRDPSIWRSHPTIPPDAVKVLFVGRVSVEKNLPLLVRAWSLVAAREPRAHLVIVGDGPYRTPMQAALEGKNAHFLGFRHGAELSALYASSDLFAFPSTTDTLGQVVMEAQSAGLPVIVTDQGGPASVVNHLPGKEQSGLVIHGDDPARWADAIVMLVGDAERRRAMGAAGHRKIQPMSIRDSFVHFWDVHQRALGHGAVQDESGPAADLRPQAAH